MSTFELVSVVIIADSMKNDIVQLRYGNILLMPTYCHSAENKGGASPRSPCSTYTYELLQASCYESIQQASIKCQRLYGGAIYSYCINFRSFSLLTRQSLTWYKWVMTLLNMYSVHVLLKEIIGWNFPQRCLMS